jgi:hypothetical protein
MGGWRAIASFKQGNKLCRYLMKSIPVKGNKSKVPDVEMSLACFWKT